MVRILSLFTCLLAFYTLNAQEIDRHQFSVNGYLRTGLGQTDGSQMVEFSAPEVPYKFRLGNEANHYGELQFNYGYQKKDSTNAFELTYMMSHYVPFGAEGDQKLPKTAQLYAKINDVVKSADLWVGRRYYMRKNVEMLDYFWLNSGQESEYGIGLENYKLENGSNLNVALIKFEYEKQNKQHQHSYLADFRYLDVPISQHSKLNFVGQLAMNDDQLDLELPKKYGYSFGARLNYNKNFYTYNANFLYRKGSTIVASPYSGKTISEYDGNFRLYDLEKASSFDFVNNFEYDDKQNFAIQGVLNYQYRDYGVGTVDENGATIDGKKSRNTLNAGFRYLYYISKHFNLAVEYGFDYLKSSKLNIEGTMQKITFSPQIAWDYGYYSRPVIRPFVTYAQWSDDFKGYTGVSTFNNKLADKNRGFSYGVQLEIWW